MNDGLTSINKNYSKNNAIQKTAYTFINDYHINVIPVNRELKRPLIDWKIYQTKLINYLEVANKFAEASGLACIAGIINNIYCIDIDNKDKNAKANLELFISKIKILNENIVPKVAVQETQNNGFHIIFKCKEIDNQNYFFHSKKLAMKEVDGKNECIFETRGEGSYFLIYPTQNYSFIYNNLTMMKDLTLEEVNLLLETAKTFDKDYYKNSNKYNDVENAKDIKKFSIDKNVNPRTFYEENITIPEIISMIETLNLTLTKTTEKEIYFKRNGSNNPVAAVLYTDRKMLYVFSVNVNILESNKAYFPYDLYAKIIHNDNHKDAYKQIVYDYNLQKTYKNNANNDDYIENNNDNYTPKNDFNIEKSIENAYKEKEKQRKIKDKENQHIEKLIYARNLVKEVCYDELKIRFNRTKNRYEYLLNNEYVEFQDKIVNDIRELILNRNKVNISETEIKSVFKSSLTAEVNPVKDFLLGLELPNDLEGGYLKNLFNALHITNQNNNIDEENLFVLFLKWFVGAVKCVLYDNYVNKYVLTIIGKQSTRKTTFFTRLLPDEISNYYDQPTFESNKKEKDELAKLATNFILNLDEIDRSTKNDVQHLKSLTTLRLIKQRKPYAENETTAIRIASFAATGNHTNLLNDPTGNSRFIILDIGNNVIDTDIMTNEFMSKCWAEVMYIEKNNPNIHYFSESDCLTVDSNNVLYETVSAENELINNYEYSAYDCDNISIEILRDERKKGLLAFKSTTEILDDLQKKTIYKLNLNRLAAELKKLNFVQKIIKEDKIAKRLWILKVKNIIEF